MTICYIVDLIVIITFSVAMAQLVLIADNETDKNCALLVYYTASSENILPTFRDKLSILTSGVKNSNESLLSQNGVSIGRSVTTEDGADRLFLEVGNKLPLLVA